MESYTMEWGAIGVMQNFEQHHAQMDARNSFGPAELPPGAGSRITNWLIPILLFLSNTELPAY